MSTLRDEIQACGFDCSGLLNGMPRIGEDQVTIDGLPTYTHLSKADQTLINACINAHGKPEGDAALTKLITLLTSEQYEAYANVRNMDSREERKNRYLEESLPFLHKLMQSEFPDSDLDLSIKKIEAEVPLWDATVEPILTSLVGTILEK